MISRKLLDNSINYLKEHGFEAPEVGIVLGTGLGKLVDQIENQVVAHYNNIPSFPLATVEFHTGKLIYGDIAGKKVVVMQGRFHLYEGYDFMDITYPIRVMHGLGIKHLLVSNAAGAVNLDMKKGDLMLLDDHINLQGGSPLAQKNIAEFGDRFVDMSAPYDAAMNTKLKEIAKQNDITLHEGVYASVVGPQLETRAEYRMIKLLGADAVGMSTVPEIIVANHLNLPVSAVSVLTDECDPDNLQPINVPDIIETAGKAEPHMVKLFTGLIQSL
jgi:purine-nucleoside phosphorylase